MKRYIPIFLLAIMMMACSSDEKKIEKTAMGWLNAVSNYDFNSAAQYATEETCNITLPFWTSIVSQMDSAAINNREVLPISIKEVKKTSDTTAIVSYTDGRYTEKIHLKKRADDWQVHLLIDNIFGYSGNVTDTLPADFEEQIIDSEVSD